MIAPSLKDVVESVIERIEFDREEDARRAARRLSGALGLFMEEERRKAVEAISRFPEAVSALRRFWRIS